MTAVAAVAALALFGQEVDARKKSKWSIKRTQQVKDRLERVYGKGLIGMHDPVTGRPDPTRMGWDNRATGGRRLGSSIQVTIAPGNTIDATTATAYWLGFVEGMKYTGLQRDTGETNLLAESETILTNCFASTYSLLSTFDTWGYNFETFNSNPGQIKIFDVLALDPINVMADSAVNYE